MDQSHVVPKGVAHIAVTPGQEPVSITFVALPNLSMLAFSAAIEPLRIANQLSAQPLYTWQVISEDGANVRCSNGVEIGVHAPLEDCVAGDMVFICSGVQPELSSSRRVADWVRRQWRAGATVGGLCTAAYTLAKAGILKGHDFTMHWENIGPFREQYPELTVKEQLFVMDDRILTCGGGSAATDLFVKLIYDRHGPQLSQAVLDMCLHHIHRDADVRQQSSRSTALGIRNEKLTQIIEHFDKNLEDAIDLNALATEHGISRRQIERLFSRHVGKTPKQYLMDLRLQRGRALLAETDMLVAEVAVACGFESSSHFSKRFRDKFGISPHHFSNG